MNPESLHSASLNGALHPFAGLPGETTSLPKTPCHQLTQCEYSEEPRGAGKRGREEWVSVLILPPPSPISLLGAGSPAVNSRPPSPCLPSTPAAPVAPADPGAQGGRGTWAPGPRRGGQAAAPRTVAAPNPKHTRTHTRARAGQSVCPEESEGASPALHSFPQRRRSRLPGASTPRSWGLQRSQLRHDPPPIRPQPPSPLHPHTQPSRLALHHDRQRRPRAGAAATPAPHSFAAPQPPQPRRRSAQTCCARLAAPRPAGDAAAAAATAKRQLLQSHAASGAAARRCEGAVGGGRTGRRRGWGAKVQAARASPRPRLLPSPPPRPHPRKPVPQALSPGTTTAISPPPRDLPQAAAEQKPGRGGGSEPESGRVADAHLPAPGGAWKLPRSAPGNRARGWGIPPTPHPTRAHTEKAPSCGSVYPPPAARRPDSDSWGCSPAQPARACPGVCAPRRPPAVRSAIAPPSGPRSPSSDRILPSRGGGRASPGAAAAAGQPFSRGPLRAGRPERGQHRRREDALRWGPRLPRGDWAEGRGAQTCLGSARSQVHCLPGPPPPPPRRERHGE